jgi:ribosomal protein S12 methylthiotransferase accessory factor
MVSSNARTMRCRSPETTLRHAREWASTTGVGDATDLTDRDVLGVPVYVTERPHARGDVFTFGKGFERIDAEVGAYMEALEYHFAEPGTGRVPTHWGSAREVAGSEQADDAILDFVPRLQRDVDLDGPLLLAAVHDLESGDEYVLPAELIHYPAPNVGQSIFGTSTNGLASGNSILEASVQALLELIERDVWSFEFIRRESMLVGESSLPDDVLEIVERAERNGLRLMVRAIPNDYGLPFFAAFVFDPNNPSRKTFNGGWACDLDRRRAVERAVAEAAQSRLAFIHGGRRGPKPRSSGSDSDSQECEKNLVRRQMREVGDGSRRTSFKDVPDLVDTGDGLQRKLDAVIGRLRLVTRKPIYRAVLTPPDAPLHAVRLVVPLLENFKEGKVRVGRRLKAAIDASAAQAG